MLYYKGLFVDKDGNTHLVEQSNDRYVYVIDSVRMKRLGKYDGAGHLQAGQLAHHTYYI